ncbi:MAG: type I DNA topoisomerase [Deltaproteobacteria bacterium]|nr:type I DNA topoisomerase [Deltaproteobacteria bacterium]MBW2085651.1 type I DNA topoisomerase [Deltaproteobacteria bacterium]
MKKALLIVESPAKARTIRKYLGPEFEVKASVGHIRDLPVNRLGVDIEHEFTPEYVSIKDKQKVISALKKAAQGKEVIYLGPDPDREGEAIAWHIADALKAKGREFKRVLFHELTPKAIRHAISHPEELSIQRFESQQARRILDRLVGYQISPLLWDKVKRGLSAGRVQSVALKIIIEREREIFAFEAEEYWSLIARLEAESREFTARLIREGQKKIELKTGDITQKIIDLVKDAPFIVHEVVSKERKRNPLPPFTTSQLQQEAFSRLRFPTRRTMSLAQRLYEGVELGPEGAVGLITYMRTDSVRIAKEALTEVRGLIKDRFGQSYLPQDPNIYRNRKGSQDAHEAVRPTSALRTPEQVKPHLSPELLALYELIWKRFVASQMKAAVIDQTSVDIKADRFIFRATGSVIKFKGFLEVYGAVEKEGKEVLPPLQEEAVLDLKELLPKQHFTQPPPRFTEATLVKELEDNGIGRPSTYAAIISTLRDKEYMQQAKGQLAPTELGFLINDLLVDNFPGIMNVDFTAGMENDLDEVEEGRAEWSEVLKRFYRPFEAELHQAEKKMLDLKREGLKTDIKCDLCGSDMVLKWGRNGPFLSCSRYPECSNAKDYIRDERGRIEAVKPQAVETEEVCEKCGRPMVIKKGRYGPFLACSGYPECKNTRPIDRKQEDLPPLPSGMEKVCDKCGSPLIVKRSRMGNLFIACANYPRCKRARPFPTGVKCPKKGCQGELVERPSKKGVFFGCSEFPKCRFTLRSRPVNRSCPVCGFPYLIEVPKRDVVEGSSAPALRCPNRNCDYKTEPAAES